MTVEAADFGRALAVIAQKLQDLDILTHNGALCLSEEGYRMRRMRQSLSWDVSISRERPIEFTPFEYRDGNTYHVEVSTERIAVDQSQEHCPPFEALDLAMVLLNRAGEIVHRWHIDRANGDQAGPMFHLQYGGHDRDQRQADIPIREPRWNHPPIELGLMCELVAANFYTERWFTTLREDRSWCSAIQICQKVSYTAYVSHLSSCLNTSYSTALSRMWNGCWG